MAVTDKEPDIAILRTLGLTPGRVMGIFIVVNRKNKCAAVGMAAASGIPKGVGARPEARVFFGERFQGGVDALFFRGRETNRRPAVAGLLQREDLRAQHGGVGDAEESGRQP